MSNFILIFFKFEISYKHNLSRGEVGWRPAGMGAGWWRRPVAWRWVGGRGQAVPMVWRWNGGGGTLVKEPERRQWQPGGATAGAPGGAWVGRCRVASFDQRGERMAVGERRQLEGAGTGGAVLLCVCVWPTGTVRCVDKVPYLRWLNQALEDKVLSMWAAHMLS
jgi:hypothetical protein